MRECQKILALLKSGDDQKVKEAMRLIYLDENSQKSAKYWYRRYLSQTRGMEWKDVLSIATIRFVERVIEDNTHIRDCSAYFHNICRNILSEKTRWNGKHVLFELFPDLPEDIEDDKLRELWKRVMSAFQLLSKQCQLFVGVHCEYRAEPYLPHHPHKSCANGQIP